MLDVEVATARQWLRVGRALGELTEIDAAFATGRISFSKVRQLIGVADACNETELLAIAERTPAGGLARELARWLQCHEEPGDTEARQHEMRSVTWRNDPDGMITATVRLTPHAAAVLMAAVDTRVMHGHHSVDPSPDGTVAPERTAAPGVVTDSGGDGTAVPSGPLSVAHQRRGASWATLAQQRADALMAVLNDGGVSVDTEVVIHVRGDGCTLDDGTPITETVVQRVVPEAFLRVLIHDAQRRPVNASGRHRHPTRRQKRVVHERDRGCVDCGATELLEYDHEPDYAITKRTVIDELKQRCWTCHRARHTE